MANLNLNPQIYDEPIEIAEKIYWAGFYDQYANFHCNPYLIVDNGEAVLIDPGSVPHFPVVARKIFSLVRPEQISHIILQHQDPDLCGAVPLFEDIINRKDLRIVCSERASFLITYYGIKSPYYLTDLNHNALTLKSGRVLKFVDAPYLHTPGVILTYDEKSRVLFSSDLFGAFDPPGEWQLYADENYPAHMAAFMEPYMPSKEIVLHTVKKMEALDIEMIAPQHGSVIRPKTQVKKYLEMLKDFDYGLYMSA